MGGIPPLHIFLRTPHLSTMQMAPIGSPSASSLKNTPLHWKMEPSSEKWFIGKNIRISKIAINTCVSLFYLLFGSPKTNFGPLLRGQPHPMLITVFLSIFDLRVTRSFVKSPFLGAPSHAPPCIDSSIHPPNF